MDKLQILSPTHTNQHRIWVVFKCRLYRVSWSSDGNISCLVFWQDPSKGYVRIQGICNLHCIIGHVGPTYKVHWPCLWVYWY